MFGALFTLRVTPLLRRGQGLCPWRRRTLSRKIERRASLRDDGVRDHPGI